MTTNKLVHVANIKKTHCCLQVAVYKCLDDLLYRGFTGLSIVFVQDAHFSCKAR